MDPASRQPDDPAQPMEQEAQQVAAPPQPEPGASVTAAAQALDINPQGLADIFYDSVVTLCADAFDTVAQLAREMRVCEGSEDGPQQAPTPEVLQMVWQGLERLHECHQGQLDEPLEKFEVHAMQTCLHVPAGLVVSAAEPQAAQQSEADEALVAQQAADVAQLQAEIAAVNQAARRARREIGMYNDALRKYGNLQELQAVAGALAGKENAAEDAAAMVAKGAQLQSECTGLERLGRQRVDGARGPPKDALAAEKELLQLHPAAQGITPADLRAFQDLLARQ